MRESANPHSANNVNSFDYLEMRERERRRGCQLRSTALVSDVKQLDNYNNVLTRVALALLFTAAAGRNSNELYARNNEDRLSKLTQYCSRKMSIKVKKR